MTLFAQSDGQPTPAIDFETVRFSRVIRAVATDGEMAIDGRMDEEVWQRAEPAMDFTQSGRSPTPGFPATQQTEVRFAYDKENLYVAFICFEEDVSKMVVHGLKKDFQGQLGDEAAIILDTLDDDRSGFWFSTNPAGAKRDLQVSNDSDFNQEWDGVWDVRVRVGEDRWVAEFIIPFKTLRFSESASQEWGVNLARKIRRVNEESFWAPLPRQDIMTRVSLAGTLTGLEGIEQGRNFKVKPYAVAGIVEQPSGTGLNSELDYDIGFDVKYGLTSSLTLDATYRTDFSQAEVDQDQVNLTRFNVFFPEKREFFLENSGVFNFGDAASTGRGANLLPFFSRKIGLSDAGVVIPIVGGGRISGNLGKQEVGFLMMKTESEASIPSNNFVIGRVKRNLLQNSYIGALITSRNSTQAGDFNRVYGTDAGFQFYQNRLNVSGYLLKSDSPGIAENETAQRFSTEWRDRVVSASVAYEKVGDNFKPDVGFVRRGDMSHYAGQFSYAVLMDENPLFRDLAFSTTYDYYAGVDGQIETRENSGGVALGFDNSASVSVSTNETFESLSTPFTRYSIPVGDYRFREFGLSINSDRSRMFGGRINFTAGDFWTGTRNSIGGDVTFKPNPHWQIDATYSRNDIKVPAGDFPTTLVGLKVLYAFSSRAFLNTFLQYHANNQFSTNIRFNILHRPLSDIYIVFNERRSTQTREVLDRGIIIKFTNLFNF